MKYKIEYGYTTGNSFGSEDCINQLEATWENEEIAGENMKAIEEHYEFYKKLDRARNPLESKSILDDHKNKSWFVEEGDPRWSIRLILDNGKEWQFHAPWIGYFESLNWVELKNENHRIEF